MAPHALTGAGMLRSSPALWELHPKRQSMGSAHLREVCGLWAASKKYVPVPGSFHSPLILLALAQQGGIALESPTEHSLRKQFPNPSPASAAGRELWGAQPMEQREQPSLGCAWCKETK